jgi:SAM-dependent MidA family methyltransferase
VKAHGRFVPWHQAWQTALYGPAGFYRKPEGPAGHFRTACHAGADVVAGALARLATEAGCTTIVDVGAGRGELLTALARLDPASRPGPERSVGAAADVVVPPGQDLGRGCGPGPGTDKNTGRNPRRSQGPSPASGGGAGQGRPRLHGVDVVGRPATLPTAVGWSGGLNELPDDVLDGALVVAWELLDVVPIPIAEVRADGIARIVLVDPATGEERLGPPLTAAETAWCAQWWPLVNTRPGARAEIGIPRDTLWAGLVERVARTRRGGLLLAVDYGHDAHGRPPEGSLSAFHGGRAVPPVPDGSCDLTTDVAVDAVAAAGERAGATSSLLLPQRTALRALGVVITPGHLADAGSAGTAALLAQLELRSRLSELLDASGLGSFTWLLQGVRRPVPATLAHAAAQDLGVSTR